MAASWLVAHSISACTRDGPGPPICRTSGKASSPGFTLLETLISMIILTLAVIGLLQALTLALRVYSLTDKHRQETLRRWNRVEQIRMGSGVGGAPLSGLSEGRRLYRFRLLDREDRQRTRWEILDGQQ